ncbi:MAG TPA: hypothetical protein VF528_19985 [Pyrinomonadaceae bacterium]|jgi:hypothetical protein
MTTPTLDEAKLKDLFKSALIEVLEERRDLIRDVLEEAIEDIALAHAIEEGAGGKRVSRQDVFKVLEGAQ